MQGMVPGTARRAKSALTADEQAAIASELNADFGSPVRHDAGPVHFHTAAYRLCIDTDPSGAHEPAQQARPTTLILSHRTCLQEPAMAESAQEAGPYTKYIVNCGIAKDADVARLNPPTTMMMMNKLCVGEPLKTERAQQSAGPMTTHGMACFGSPNETAQSAIDVTLRPMLGCYHGPSVDSAGSAANPSFGPYCYLAPDDTAQQARPTSGLGFPFCHNRPVEATDGAQRAANPTFNGPFCFNSPGDHAQQAAQPTLQGGPGCGYFPGAH